MVTLSKKWYNLRSKVQNFQCDQNVTLISSNKTVLQIRKKISAILTLFWSLLFLLLLLLSPAYHPRWSKTEQHYHGDKRPDSRFVGEKGCKSKGGKFKGGEKKRTNQKTVCVTMQFTRCFYFLETISTCWYMYVHKTLVSPMKISRFCDG